MELFQPFPFKSQTDSGEYVGKIVEEAVYEIINGIKLLIEPRDISTVNGCRFFKSKGFPDFQTIK